jgi:hypothetical protein
MVQMAVRIITTGLQNVYPSARSPLVFVVIDSETVARDCQRNNLPASFVYGALNVCSIGRSCFRVFLLKSNVNEPMNSRLRNVMTDFRVSQRCCWKMKSSGMLYCVVAVVLDVSRDHSASSSLISSYDPWKRRQMTMHTIPEEMNLCISIITTAICSSVRPHGTTLPLDGFSWNLIFEYFSTILLLLQSALQPLVGFRPAQQEGFTECRCQRHV